MLYFLRATSRIMTEYLKLKVPATSANLGAGFDVFGIALEKPADIIEIEKSDRVQVIIKGREAKYIPIDPRKNTAGVIASNLEKPVKITIHRNIPLSSGLGSSAAPAAGIAFALNRMYDLKLSTYELVQLAASGEAAAVGISHADNVAPALLGGFVIVHKNKVISLKPENIGVVAVHPDIVVSTRKARAILPSKLSLDDVSFNIGSSACMVVGMMRNDIALIGESMENRIIEERRSRMITGYQLVKKSALEAGAAGVTISGSGPTMIAICEMKQREEVAQAMKHAFLKSNVRSEAFITTIGKGVEIIAER